MDSINKFLSHVFNSEFDWEREAVAPLVATAPIWYAVGFAYLPLAFAIRENSDMFKAIRPLLKTAWGEAILAHCSLMLL